MQSAAFFLLLSIKAFSSPKATDPYSEKTLSKAELMDKVKGGWAGNENGYEPGRGR